jgi:hypothetical protein
MGLRLLVDGPRADAALAAASGRWRTATTTTTMGADSAQHQHLVQPEGAEEAARGLTGDVDRALRNARPRR